MQRSAKLKAFIDSLGGLWSQGRLAGKVGSVFSASSPLHGGNETTIMSLYPPLSHPGLIIVPLGYTDPVLYSGSSCCPDVRIPLQRLTRLVSRSKRSSTRPTVWSTMSPIEAGCV